jgi:hypothetical protein
MPKNSGSNLSRRTMVPALAGVLLTLIIVGGFLAVDRTVLHWYSGGGESNGSTPQATATPVYSSRDVLALALTQFSHTPVPQGVHSIHCYDAHYVSENQTWVVRCGYWATKPTFPTPGIPDHPPDYPQTFSFDDKTGELK